MRRFKETPSRTSPRSSRRGCLCRDGKTYSKKCCSGALMAQGIGRISGISTVLSERGDDLYTENNERIIPES